MPISVACACKVKLRVPDTAAGKAVKCPKCGATIKVPAGEAANGQTAAVTTAPVAAAVKPAAAKAAVRPGPAASAPPAEDNDLDILEEVPGPPRPGRVKPAGASPVPGGEIPEHLQEKVQPLLETGEKVVWIGQASPTVAFRRARFMWIVAIFTLAFAGFFALMILVGPFSAAFKGPGPMQATMLLFLLPVAVMVGVSGLMFAFPFYKKWAAKGSCYVVTNRRCLVWYGTFGRSEVYLPGQLGNLRTRAGWFCGDDAGDVVFRSVTTITTTYYKRGPSSTSSSTRYYGFLDLDNMSEVEAIIRTTLLDRWQRKIKKLASLDDNDE